MGDSMGPPRITPEQLRFAAQQLAFIKTSRRPDPIPASVVALEVAAAMLEYQASREASVNKLLVELELILPEMKVGLRGLAAHHRYHNTSKSEQRLERLADKWQNLASRLGTLNNKVRRVRQNG